MFISNLEIVDGKLNKKLKNPSRSLGFMWCPEGRVTGKT